MDMTIIIVLIFAFIIGVVPAVWAVIASLIKSKKQKELEDQEKLEKEKKLEENNYKIYKAIKPKAKEPVEIANMLNAQHESGYKLHEIYGDIFIFKYMG